MFANILKKRSGNNDGAANNDGSGASSSSSQPQAQRDSANSTGSGGGATGSGNQNNHVFGNLGKNISGGLNTGMNSFF